MIKVNCKFCNDELIESGGLLFSPPIRECAEILKFHICISCWSFLQNLKLKNREERRKIGLND